MLAAGAEANAAATTECPAERLPCSRPSPSHRRLLLDVLLFLLFDVNSVSNELQQRDAPRTEVVGLEEPSTAAYSSAFANGIAGL